MGDLPASCGHTVMSKRKHDEPVPTRVERPQHPTKRANLLQGRRASIAKTSRGIMTGSTTGRCATCAHQASLARVADTPVSLNHGMFCCFHHVVAALTHRSTPSYIHSCSILLPASRERHEQASPRMTMLGLTLASLDHASVRAVTLSVRSSCCGGLSLGTLPRVHVSILLLLPGVFGHSL